MSHRVALKVVGMSFGFALVFISNGCSTWRRVEHREGHGRKQVFAAPFDRTWNASLNAIYGNQLTLLLTNLTTDGGFISAEQGLHFSSFGENVGIWVIPASPAETKVEVVSRQKGALLWPKNWERPLLHAIAANLGQEPVSHMAAPTKRAPTKNVPTAAVPASSASSKNSIVLGTKMLVRVHTEKSSDLQQRREELREYERQRVEELRLENNVRRRAHLQSELDYIRQEIRVVEGRLSRVKE